MRSSSWRPQGRTPADEALAEILHACRLLDQLLDLDVDREDDRGLEVAASELVLDALDDLDRVLVLDFAAVDAAKLLILLAASAVATCKAALAAIDCSDRRERQRQSSRQKVNVEQNAPSGAGASAGAVATSFHAKRGS
jgi:hypothetical protein